MPEQLNTAISGSFQFKYKIDAAIDAFADLDVNVLEPTKGWLAIPRLLAVQPSFRPLPAERGLGIKQIEDRFLRAIRHINFLYVYSEDGHVGLSTAMEIGFAIAHDPELPIYTAEPIAVNLSEGNLERYAFLNSRLVVASIEQAVQIERAGMASLHEAAAFGRQISAMFGQTEVSSLT